MIDAIVWHFCVRAIYGFEKGTELTHWWINLIAFSFLLLLKFDHRLSFGSVPVFKLCCSFFRRIRVLGYFQGASLTKTNARIRDGKM